MTTHPWVIHQKLVQIIIILNNMLPNKNIGIACQTCGHAHIEGTTHSFNDGCGCPEHNDSRITESYNLLEKPEWEKGLREEFRVKALQGYFDTYKKGEAELCEPLIADYWISKLHSELEKYRSKIFKMKVKPHKHEKDCRDFSECRDFSRFERIYNGALEDVLELFKR